MRIERIGQALLGLALLTLAACANGPVLGEGVGAMRTGLAQAKTDTGKAFADINASRRDFAIEDVLDKNRAPDVGDFRPVISNETAAEWDNAFDKIDDYFEALQDLVGTKRSEETKKNLGAIGSALQADTIGVKLPKGSAEFFSALGGAIVQAMAEKKALDVMRRTDPAFQRLMRKLGDLVSGPDNASLSSILTTQWKRKLDDIAADKYGKVRSGTRDERKPVIEAYAAALDQRNAKLAALASLRSSLLALGEAHAAAAKGQDGATLYWIGQLNDRLKEARADAKSGEK